MIEFPHNIGTVFIMLGFSCNFRCKYCLQHEDKKTIITDTLSSNYNMSYDEAVELYNAGSRNDYTLSIIEKLKELGLYDQK